MSGVVEGLVSVIVPVYNRTNLLREAIASAVAQIYRPIEIIIVDDGSTEESARREIDRLITEHSALIRAIRVSNRGPGLARQAGLDIARGEYVQFLDSDDLLLPPKLSLQVAGLRACPECALSYGKTREYNIGDEPADLPARYTGEVHEKLFPAAMNGRLWATETPLFRKTALDSIGPWSSLRVLEDWEYECRLGAVGAKLHYCDAFVSDHRHHSGAREGLRWQHDSAAFKDMLDAYDRVLGYARDAGVERSSSEMSRFARNLFRLARDAGARGRVDDAARLLRQAKDVDVGRHIQYHVYDWLTRILGWKRAARWGEAFSSLVSARRGTRRQETLLQ